MPTSSTAAGGARASSSDGGGRRASTASAAAAAAASASADDNDVDPTDGGGGALSSASSSPSSSAAPAPAGASASASASSEKASSSATAAAAAAAPHYNPASKWEEPVEVPSLTLFDVHRKPREVNDDPTARVRMPLKVLNAEFHCPVCLGYMKKTSIVMECLHRFCGECIQKCLRLGKKECPSCRIHIPSRRSLRPDPNFDELIKNIYGDVESLEESEVRRIESLNRAKNMNNAYAESRKRGIRQQAIHRQKKKPNLGGRGASTAGGGGPRSAPSTTGEGGAGGGAGAAGAGGETPTIANLEESQLVDFVLRRHPQEILVDRLQREYLRIAKGFTVSHLKQFLGKKLSYEPCTHFQILASAGGRSVILDDSITIGDVKRDICDSPERELVLHFRIFPVY